MSDQVPDELGRVRVVQPGEQDIVLLLGAGDPVLVEELQGPLVVPGAQGQVGRLCRWRVSRVS